MGINGGRDFKEFLDDLIVDAVKSGNLMEVMNQKAIFKSKGKEEQVSRSNAVVDRAIGNKWCGQEVSSG